jgi:hypothetical protein
MAAMKRYRFLLFAPPLIGLLCVTYTVHWAFADRRARPLLWLAGLMALGIGLAWVVRGRRELKAVVRAFLSFTGLYCLVVLAGLLIVLVSCSFVGYLAYSDRPGPGWETPHMPDWQEVWFYAEWELMALPMFLFFGAIFFLFAAVLGYLQTPRLLVRVIAGLLCCVLTALAIADHGWYIALAPLGGNVAGILGLLFGAFIFPLFAERGKFRLPMWLRATGISVASLGLAAWILHPLFR